MKKLTEKILDGLQKPTWIIVEKVPGLEELKQENIHLEKWIDDLQSGMYINCVYCGHRYPPGTQAVKRKVLYEHIKQCPKHPLSIAELRIKELERLCPYCKEGQLTIIEALKIGSYDIVCSECGSRWVDEDDVFEMK